MKDKIISVVMLGVMLTFLVILFIDAIRQRKTQKAWFSAGAILTVGIAWGVNFIRLWV